MFTDVINNRLIWVGVLFFVLVAIGPAKAAGPEGIDISFEKQHAFKDGKQKFVVTISNKSKDLFKGTVTVKGVDASGKTVDSDVILLDEGLPGSGSQKTALLWFKQGHKIHDLKIEVSGKTEAQKTVDIGVPYEETGLDPGNSHMTVLLFTPTKDKGDLMKIAQVYDERFAKLGGFRILFFSNRKNTPKKFPLSKANEKAQYATYWKNRNNGKSGLDLE